MRSRKRGCILEKTPLEKALVWYIWRGKMGVPTSLWEYYIVLSQVMGDMHGWATGMIFYTTFPISSCITRWVDKFCLKKTEGCEPKGYETKITSCIFVWECLNFLLNWNRDHTWSFLGNGNPLSTGCASPIWWETREIRCFLSKTQTGVWLGPEGPATKTFQNEMNYTFCGLISAPLHYSLFQLKSQ